MRLFPLKTALAIVTCALMLGAARYWLGAGKGLTPGIFAEAWRLGSRHAAAGAPPAAAAVEQPMEARAPLAGKADEPRRTISDVLVDGDGALDPFFAALARLEMPGATEQVSILHYGDSPTTADLITGDARALLQARFGNGGHGYLLIAKPWAWYGHRDTDISGKGWEISTAVGKGRAEIYGLGGASFTGTAGAASRITLKDAAAALASRMVLSYLGGPDGGTVEVSGDDGQMLGKVQTAAEAREPAWGTVTLPSGTKTVDLRVSSGKVTLFGESFERERPGVIYNSLGLNGASTTVLSRGFNAEAWAAELRHDQPALVIINYGTNESSFGSFVDRQYAGELRLAIERIRTALPSVSILVMSPMDRGERSGIAEIETMATIPRIIAIQRRVAAETHCAFFDTFDAMGGDGTMARWYTGRPRLVAGDLIHPTPQGAAMVAEIFVKNLMLGYEGYRARVGAAAPAPAAKQAAQP